MARLTVLAQGFAQDPNVENRMPKYLDVLTAEQVNLNHTKIAKHGMELVA